MGTQEAADLSRRLIAYAPASLLAIGPRAGELLAPYRRTHPECAVSSLDPEGTMDGDALLDALGEHGRFDFVILRGVLERIDANTGAHLMARLRDVHTRRLCVVVDTGDAARRWQTADLIAMGLSHWSSETLNDAVLEVYGFDLGTYKATPDWLNARHWAHPEHWGKFRW